MTIEMLNVSGAKKIIEENAVALQPVTLALQQTSGLVLALDIYAAFDIPAFPQSSMDGYAFSFASLKKDEPLQLSGEMAAGSNDYNSVLPGHTVRIFTGAPVPPGTDTVVMQEKSKLTNGKLIPEDENLKAGDNVRQRGSEIRKGSLALEAGTVLSPAAIGFLASIGFAELPVYPKPKISIIVTGNELQAPGQPLQYGQVYEANSFSLAAALEKYGIGQITRYHCGDNLDALSSLLGQALEQSDIVLLTGGVSVGDYDFTKRATESCGVITLFHKVKQRPGKPILFGKKGTKLVFGLPGNPASVLSCFYMYVAPAIEKLSCQKSLVKKMIVQSGNMIKKPGNITWFLKGQYENDTAKILDAQESYRLSSFARANCLVQLEEEQTLCNPGDPVIIHLLP